ncbi:MAG: hypothetical protein P1P84_08905 [Deferrisomatales bacterium]|nr:hypothetical protein [Deferrisomatales bacterium]
MKNRGTLLATLVLFGGLAFAATPALAADHPGSGADCGSCHGVAATAPAPKVIPAEPGFFAKLFGQKSLRGHQSVSCAGQVQADGTVSGCHRPESGGPAFLVRGGGKEAVDLLCGSCHAAQRALGSHHPSYLADRDGDGTPETAIRPAAGQEVYGVLAAPAKGVDVLEFTTDAEGKRHLVSRIPLQTVSVPSADGFVDAADVLVCTSCHNPHFGYLVEVGSEEELNSELVARGQGDALLRLRDYDNTLCEACH